MWMSIDPGSEGAWAVWTGSNALRSSKSQYPSRYGIVRSNARSWESQVEECWDQYDGILRHVGPVQTVYCEWPSYFSSFGGQIVADSGALVKLVYFVGGLAKLCLHAGCRFVPIDINAWKGQLTKEAVIYQLEQVIPAKVREGYKSHVWDAVGIGLYVQGRF